MWTGLLVLADIAFFTCSDVASIMYSLNTISHSGSDSVFFGPMDMKLLTIRTHNTDSMNRLVIDRIGI